MTHVFNFAAGSKISALKVRSPSRWPELTFAQAQVCAHFIPKEPANDYVLALTEVRVCIARAHAASSVYSVQALTDRAGGSFPGERPPRLPNPAPQTARASSLSS